MDIDPMLLFAQMFECQWFHFTPGSRFNHIVSNSFDDRSLVETTKQLNSNLQAVTWMKKIDSPFFGLWTYKRRKLVCVCFKFVRDVNVVFFIKQIAKFGVWDELLEIASHKIENKSSAPIQQMHQSKIDSINTKNRF